MVNKCSLRISFITIGKRSTEKFLFINILFKVSTKLYAWVRRKRKNEGGNLGEERVLAASRYVSRPRTESGTKADADRETRGKEHREGASKKDRAASCGQLCALSVSAITR